MLVYLEINRVKPVTVLIETVLSGDPLYLARTHLVSDYTYCAVWIGCVFTSTLWKRKK